MLCRRFLPWLGLVRGFAGARGLFLSVASVPFADRCFVSHRMLVSTGRGLAACDLPSAEDLLAAERLRFGGNLFARGQQTPGFFCGTMRRLGLRTCSCNMVYRASHLRAAEGVECRACGSIFANLKRHRTHLQCRGGVFSLFLFVKTATCCRR